MSLNSKQKGKRAELEVVHLLKDHGFVARRGQQFAGNPDAPDVVAPDLGFHIEVKHQERAAMRDWVAQAGGDSGGKPWVVFFRFNHGPWLVVTTATDFLTLVNESKL